MYYDENLNLKTPAECIKEKKLLNPTCDATFKTLFTDNSNEGRLALKSFLEAILDAKVTNIQLRPNETAIESDSDKQARFDVTCTLNGTEVAEIEMQGWNINNCYDRRAEYLAAHLLNHYTEKSMDWEKTPKVFQISVLNFIYDGTTEENLSIYRMRTEDNRRLSDRMTIFFIELPKVENLPDDIKRLTLIEKWSKFLLYANREDKKDFVRQLCESEEGIMAVQATLARISEDEDNWWRERARMKAYKDHITMVHGMERMNQELNKASLKLNQTTQELNQTTQELNQTTQELNQTTQELNQTTQELNQTTQELNQTTQELNQTKQELNQVKEDAENATHNAKLETARNLLKMGLTPEQISQATRLSLDEVTKLQVETSATA